MAKASVKAIARDGRRGVRMLDEILKDVSDYVAWKLEEGSVSVEASPETVAGLAARGTTTMPTTKVSETSGTSATPEIASDLASIAREIASCNRCVLHAERTHTVPGQGNPKPEILFIGEAPGKDEDEQGLAFVGRAGKLLTKMIEAMGFNRDDVFIANINKCRPPGNRKPTREEMDTCLPFLKRQIAVLKPKVIIAMGATAVEGLVPLPEGKTISKVRGEWLTFEGIPLMPTYHPAYLLRNPAMKRPVWEDLKTVLGFLGRPVPSAKK
jgi:uracil-DNA glycosylase family 4